MKGRWKEMAFEADLPVDCQFNLEQNSGRRSQIPSMRVVTTNYQKYSYNWVF
jgi:hypothetical protein